MEIKDLLGPAVSMIAIVVTITIYSRNNQRERKKEFSELRAAMEKDKQVEIEKVKEDAAKALNLQKQHDEQEHKIATLETDLRNHKVAHEELRADLHDIKGVLTQVLQKMAVFEQSFRQKMKGITE